MLRTPSLIMSGAFQPCSECCFAAARRTLDPNDPPAHGLFVEESQDTLLPRTGGQCRALMDYSAVVPLALSEPLIPVLGSLPGKRPLLRPRIGAQQFPLSSRKPQREAPNRLTVSRAGRSKLEVDTYELLEARLLCLNRRAHCIGAPPCGEPLR